jgi:hypothetical protein
MENRGPNFTNFPQVPEEKIIHINIIGFFNLFVNKKIKICFLSRTIICVQFQIENYPLIIHKSKIIKIIRVFHLRCSIINTKRNKKKMILSSILVW